MRKTRLGCTILEGHDVADLPLVSENAEILDAELKKLEDNLGKVVVPVKSVSGKTGAVTLTKTDVGLTNVDNIKQASKIEFDEHKADNVKHITPTERSNWNKKEDALSVDRKRKITFGTADPTGGVNGDIYFQYE